MFVPHLPEPDAIFPATLTGMVAIRGATLAGVAAAARLSRLGHDVTLHTAGVRPGGRWTPDSHQDHAVDAMPQVITLPAAWRDVFKKSGRAFDPLARAGLRLVAAPPAVHRFADGSELELPTERGAQYHALAARYGDAVAARWRTLLDDADDVWLAARRAGVEAPHRPESREAATLWLDRTLTDLADRITSSSGTHPPGPQVLRRHIVAQGSGHPGNPARHRAHLRPMAGRRRARPASTAVGTAGASPLPRENPGRAHH